MNKFYIHTLGCKVNQYESQAMRESLLDAGFVESESRSRADLYILNTCTVTQKADKESRYLINAFHRTNSKARIVVTGCYTEKDAEEISSIPGVTHIVKNSEKSRIAEYLNEKLTTNDERRDYVFPSKITRFKGHAKAFVKIQDGCENSCAYCKIPLVRGPLKSRPLGEILEEAACLIGNGYKEIVLTGICLGAWGKDLASSHIARSIGFERANFTDLLKAVASIKGDFRVRLSSIELKYVTDELIEFLASEKKVCRHLHLPLQSGDDCILSRMNRPYDAQLFEEVVDKIRDSVEDVGITTDLMIGFPGEEDSNFDNSLNFLRHISPARTHIFTFSKRFGTAAYNMPAITDRSIIKKRFMKMEGAALNASYLFRRKFVDRKLNVLVESKRNSKTGELTGYTDNYIDVVFPGPDEIIGHIVPVKITQTDPVTTRGVYEQL